MTCACKQTASATPDKDYKKLYEQSGAWLALTAVGIALLFFLGLGGVQYGQFLKDWTLANRICRDQLWGTGAFAAGGTPYVWLCIRKDGAIVSITTLNRDEWPQIYNDQKRSGIDGN